MSVFFLNITTYVLRLGHPARREQRYEAKIMRSLILVAGDQSAEISITFGKLPSLILLNSTVKFRQAKCS